jgi:hypothetical protein
VTLSRILTSQTIGMPANRRAGDLHSIGKAIDRHIKAIETWLAELESQIVNSETESASAHLADLALCPTRVRNALKG